MSGIGAEAKKNKIQKKTKPSTSKLKKLIEKIMQIYISFNFRQK